MVTRCLHCGGQVVPGAGYEGETQCLACGRPPEQRAHEEPENVRDAIIARLARVRRRAVAS